jgi:hypothetical protein
LGETNKLEIPTNESFKKSQSLIFSSILKKCFTCGFQTSQHLEKLRKWNHVFILICSFSSCYESDSTNNHIVKPRSSQGRREDRPCCSSQSYNRDDDRRRWSSRRRHHNNHHNRRWYDECCASETQCDDPREQSRSIYKSRHCDGWSPRSKYDDDDDEDEESCSFSDTNQRHRKRRWRSDAILRRNDYRRWCGVQDPEAEESQRCESPPDRCCTESHLEHIDRKLRSLECGFNDIRRRSSQGPHDASLATDCDYAPCCFYDAWDNGEGASCKDAYSVGEVPRGNRESILCNNQSKYRVASLVRWLPKSCVSHFNLPSNLHDHSLSCRYFGRAAGGGEEGALEFVGHAFDTPPPTLASYVLSTSSFWDDKVFIRSYPSINNHNINSHDVKLIYY